MKMRIYHHHSNPDSISNSKINSLVNTLKDIPLSYSKGCSPKIRETIAYALLSQGWSSKVKLSVKSRITITAMNGTSALCLQTGNISRIYADLLKIQYLYQKTSITDAVYLIPTKKNAKIIGSNVANFERMVQELELFVGFITVPITIIGLD